jgi:hypothetical protein
LQDLNATMFYKAKFNIQATDKGPDDLLWHLVLNIRGWITNKWNSRGKDYVIESRLGHWSHFKTGGKFYDLGHLNRIYAESVFHEENNDPATISWACKIVEKPEAESGYAPREWVTEIGFKALSTNEGELSYVVTYSDMAGFIGFCQPTPAPSVPRVIRNILKDSAVVCSIGPDTLRPCATKLTPGDFPEFKEILFSEKRVMPIIYISPRRIAEDSDDAQTLIDPQKIADSVAANALVFYADSLEFTQEMKYMGISNYQCANGAIRVFRPNIDLQDEADPNRHRFLSARFIEEHGADKIVDMLRRAIAQDVHFYETLFRVEDCRALIEDKMHQEKIERIRKQSQGEADEAATAFLEESEKRAAAERTNRVLQEQIDQLKSENYNLSVQRDMYKGRAEQVGEIVAAAKSVRCFSEYPNTPEDIARYFETVYAERIAFTDRAYRSMEDCGTKNDVLWEAFYRIANDLYDLIKSNSSTAYNEFKNQTGWEIARCEGRQTRCDSKMMRQYIDKYNDQEIDIEAHVKNGNRESDPKFVRIYFAYDPSVADKIIIGHCGSHLENFSTRKARR